MPAKFCFSTPNMGKGVIVGFHEHYLGTAALSDGDYLLASAVMIIPLSGSTGWPLPGAAFQAMVSAALAILCLKWWKKN